MSRSRSSSSRRIGPVVQTLEGRLLLNGSIEHPAHLPTAHVQMRSAHRPTADRWSWLADTYWYVPTRNVPAVIYEPGSGALVPIQDQTVYHISGYKNGYFWGETVSQFGSNPASSAALVGSVTPQGRVLLSFTSSVATQGYGTMTRLRGRWTMENQMFTSTGSSQIGHWAYMLPTRPGMQSWESLPSAGVSVPDFLGQYSAPVPRPIGPPAGGP